MDLHKIFSEVEKIDPEINERMDTRRQAMRQFANIGKVVALSALPIALGGMFKKAYGRAPSDVLAVLNYALTLEYLEAEFYDLVVKNHSGLLSATELAAFTKIGAHETAHVNFLKTAITGASGTPITKPTFDFGAAFETNASILGTAQALEDTGVRAYKGQATVLMENPAVLTAALQIHSIEARHAAHIRYLRGQKPWITGKQNDVGQPSIYAGEENEVQAGITITGIDPQVDAAAATEAFDEPLTMAQGKAIAGNFIVS